jgi:hypothetical protein
MTTGDVVKALLMALKVSQNAGQHCAHNKARSMPGDRIAIDEGRKVEHRERIVL